MINIFIFSQTQQYNFYYYLTYRRQSFGLLYTGPCIIVIVEE